MTQFSKSKSYTIINLTHLTWVILYAVILGQVVFYTEATVVYSNIVSLLLVPPFVGYLFVGRKIVFDQNLGFYFGLCLYFISSYFWHAFQDQLTIRDFRSHILLPIQLFIVFNLVSWSRGINALMLAYCTSIFLNFIIYLTHWSIPLWGVIERSGRFQGVYQNPNALSFVATIGMLFSVLILSREKKRAYQLLASLALVLGSILNMATGSKKALLLTALIWIVYLFLSQGVGVGKLLTRVLTVLPILIVVGMLFMPFIDYKSNFDLMNERFEEFSSVIVLGESHAGLGLRESSTGQRLYFIRSGIELFKENPFIGTGVNSFKFSHLGHYSHNNYIELIVNGGVFAFFLFYYRYWIACVYIQRLNSNTRYVYLSGVLVLILTDVVTVSVSDKHSLYAFMIIFMLIGAEVRGREQAGAIISPKSTNKVNPIEP